MPLPDSQILELENLASASFGEQVYLLRELFGLTKKDFAEILSVNEKTIRRWEEEGARTIPQSSHKKAIVALKAIAETLGEVFEPDTIKVWVDKPNPALQGERPRDFVKKPGGIFLMSHLLGAVGR